MVAAFKWGLGTPFGLIEYDQITGWIPVFLFAMLFGLSMDYEVFLVSRMREEWDATHDNQWAVAQGLAKTGRLVTAAGLIMFAPPRARHRLVRRPAAVRIRARRRDPDRRHDRPRVGAPERNGAVRTLELVAPGLGRARRPRGAVRAPGPHLGDATAADRVAIDRPPDEPSPQARVQAFAPETGDEPVVAERACPSIELVAARGTTARSSAGWKPRAAGESRPGRLDPGGRSGSAAASGPRARRTGPHRGQPCLARRPPASSWTRPAKERRVGAGASGAGLQHGSTASDAVVDRRKGADLRAETKPE